MAAPLRRRIRDFGLDLNRLYHRRLLTRDYYTEGIDVMGSDWDTLAILDACRYDLFAERNTIGGTLEKKRSRGSATREFLEANFTDSTHHDTVYVSATPQITRFKDEIGVDFHDIITVWDKPDNLWKGLTPLPETTTKYAIDAAQRYPDKRLIVHYTQPHIPFIPHDGPLPSDGTMWNELRDGALDVDRDTLWEAYAENLELALPHVQRLLDAVDGKSVVTSDHGNLLGRRTWPVPVRWWGHPHSVYMPELIEVPWLVYDSGLRREIRAEAPAETTDETVDDSIIEDRLADLGYV